MDAIGLGVLASLADDPVTRPELVKMLREHARESFASMVGPLEPGERWLLRVLVVDDTTGAAIPGATVAMHHADRDGLYCREKNLSNVRLAGAIQVDAQGVGFLASIFPGYYSLEHDPEGNEPRRVHYFVRTAGYQDHTGEALFDDDARAEGVHTAAPKIRMQPKQGNLWRGELTLRRRAR